MLEWIVWITGVTVLIGVMAGALGFFQALAWEQMWKHRLDWPIFIAYSFWLMRYKKKYQRASWLRKAAERMESEAKRLDERAGNQTQDKEAT